MENPGGGLGTSAFPQPKGGWGWSRVCTGSEIKQSKTVFFWCFWWMGDDPRMPISSAPVSPPFFANFWSNAPDCPTGGGCFFRQGNPKGGVSLKEGWKALCPTVQPQTPFGQRTPFGSLASFLSRHEPPGWKRLLPDISQNPIWQFCWAKFCQTVFGAKCQKETFTFLGRPKCATAPPARGKTLNPPH